MSKEFILDTQNTMTITNKYYVGQKELYAEYKIPKHRCKLIVDLGNFPNEITETEINKLLKGTKLVCGDNFQRHLEKTGG